MTSRFSPEGGAILVTPKPSRSASAKGRNVNRNAILRAGLRLSTDTALQELSIVSVAKALKIAPALIHYHIGGRDWMTSGIMNLFYKGVLKKWPDAKGIWEADLIEAATLIYDEFCTHAGIAAYAVANSRFRIFQLTAFGDRDYGVEMLERLTGLVRASGLSGERTGVYANQLFGLIVGAANDVTTSILPAAQEAFHREKCSQLEMSRYPNLDFAQRIPVRLGDVHTFDEGCKLILHGIRSECGGVTMPDLGRARLACGGTGPDED